MSADIAAFLAAVGTEPLERLEWNGWAIEDSALGTILAGEASLFHPLYEEKKTWKSLELQRNPRRPRSLKIFFFV